MAAVRTSSKQTSRSRMNTRVIANAVALTVVVFLGRSFPAAGKDRLVVDRAMPAVQALVWCPSHKEV